MISSGSLLHFAPVTGLMKAISGIRGLILTLLVSMGFVPYTAGAAAAVPKNTGPVVEVSIPGGFYKEPFYLVLSTGNSEDKIYFTLDGSTPGADSYLYVKPLLIEDRTTSPSVFSIIPTNPGLTQDLLSELENPSARRAPVWRWSARLLDSRGWLAPEGEVFKGTVVRAVAVSSDGKAGEVITQTYFISNLGAQRYQLPVVSLAGDYKDFFGEERGIFVYGKEGNPLWGKHPANFRQRGRKWERPAHVEFFESDGSRVFGKTAGVRLNGRGGRWSAQKSLRLYARKEYGRSTFNYPFFGESELKKRKRLVIRNGGHAPNLFPNHDLAYRIVSPAGLDSTRSRHVVVFMNGEYWGVHTLNERLDSHFLSRKYGIDRENLILKKRHELKEGDDEDDEELLALFAFLESEDIGREDIFLRVLKEIDIDQFIEYQVAQIYLANRDWPRNNYTLWKAREAEQNGSYGSDGKWRFLFFDLDGGFGNTQVEQRTPFHRTIESAVSSGLPARFLRSLFRNESFRHSFLNRLATRLNTIYSSEAVLKEIRTLHAELTPEMLEHVRRWRYPSMAESYLERKGEKPGLSRWEQTFDEFRTFAKERPSFLREHALEYFKLEGMYEIKVLPVGNCPGQLDFDGVTLPETVPGGQWSGLYFSGIPVKISAVSSSKCCFEKWEGASDASDASAEVVLKTSQDTVLRPRFASCDF